MLSISNSNNNPRPSTNALELIIPAHLDEKIITSDEDRKQLRLVAIALAERFVNHLFGCEPEQIEKSGLPPLNEFIYRVIRRTNSSITTLFLALIYLIRLKQKHPACKGTNSSPHRLLLAALIIAYKYLYDNCYHNRSWAQVSQGLFKVEEINKMEVELLFFLGFQLYVSKQHWSEFVEFMDGKLTRSLSQTPNRNHLRKVLWVEVFPENGIKLLYNFSNNLPQQEVGLQKSVKQIPKSVVSSRRSTPSLRSSLSNSSMGSSKTVVNPSLSLRHSMASLKEDKNSKNSTKCPSPSSTLKDSSPDSEFSSSTAQGTPNQIKTESKVQRQLLNKVSSVFGKGGDTISHAWLDLHSSLLNSRRRRESNNNTENNGANETNNNTGNETQLSKSILSNVTLRSHHRRSQKFSLPPIWNLMSNNNLSNNVSETKP
ncbi:hypothetical protein K502DRAFT_324650 [Neoconidiobolus thromboides FSU 785]|nr:hypothetical protein K502DRAFT_324650 [Neoconidiobolus thromboides FSU 785]